MDKETYDNLGSGVTSIPTEGLTNIKSYKNLYVHNRYRILLASGPRNDIQTTISKLWIAPDLNSNGEIIYIQHSPYTVDTRILAFVSNSTEITLSTYFVCAPEWATLKVKELFSIG